MNKNRAEETPPEKIRTELNIEKWSIWRPANARTKPKARTFERDVRLPDGTRIVAKLKIGFTDEGNLTTEDQKVYYALVKVWEERGRTSGLIPLSLKRLARTLRKAWGQKTREALRRSLLRLRITPFIWEQAYVDGSTGKALHLLDTFSVLSDLKIVRRENDGHVTTEMGHFRFHEAILKNLLASHTKPVLLGVVLSFRGEIAQLVYSHLDIVISDKASYERRTAELFEDLGLEGGAYTQPSKRKQMLEPALKELQGVQLTTGTITTAQLAKTKDGKDYKLIVRKGKSTTIGGEGATEPRAEIVSPPLPAKDSPTAQAEELVRHFHRVFHGAEEALLTARALDQAASLITQLGMERARHVIDFAHREAPKTKHRVVTFGGVLQYATAALRDFDRRTTAPAARETAEQAARQAQALAREAEDQIQAYWESFSPEQRAAFDAEALAQASPEARAGYETATSSQVRRMHLTVLREALVRHRLGLPATD